MIRDPNGVAYAVLRCTTGFVFLLFGVGKLQGGVPQFVAGLHEQFSKTWLPAFVVGAVGWAVPYLQLIVGALLVLGLLTRLAALIMGLLMLVLTVGLTIAGSANVAHNFIYALVAYVLLRQVADNSYCLDRRK